VRAAAIGLCLFASGCAGSGSAPLREGLHLVFMNEGVVTDEQVLLTSSEGACAQQQELLDGMQTLAEATNIRWPNDWGDRAQLERYCADQVARAELEASVYGAEYEVGHWRLRFRFWRDGPDDGLQPGVFSPDGDGIDGGVVGDYVEVFSDPYEGYREIDYDCVEYASAYLREGDSPFAIPTTPTLEELHESLDQARLTDGDVHVERDGGPLTLRLEGGELADNYGRHAGDLELETQLTDCTLDR
jgi:hypothetical protein